LVRRIFLHDGVLVGCTAMLSALVELRHSPPFLLLSSCRSLAWQEPNNLLVIELKLDSNPEGKGDDVHKLRLKANAIR